MRNWTALQEYRGNYMTQWWMPFIVASMIAFILVLLTVWQQSHHQRLSLYYRKKYLRLVQTISKAGQLVTGLERALPGISQQMALLDHYENCLAYIEGVLETTRKIAPYGSDHRVLNTALKLANECLYQVQKSGSEIERVLAGKNVNLANLHARTNHAFSLNCYFCSRPFYLTGLSRTRIRLDGVVKSVQSCSSCKGILLEKKRIKVLYFMRNGKPVHWSNIPEYKPSAEYWHLNERQVNLKDASLKLVRPADEADDEPSN